MEKKIVKLTDRRALTSGGVTAELVRAEVVAVLKRLLDVAACRYPTALDKPTPIKIITYRGRMDIIHLVNSLRVRYVGEGEHFHGVPAPNHPRWVLC